MPVTYKSPPEYEGKFRITNAGAEQFRDGEWQAYSRVPVSPAVSAPPFERQRPSLWALLRGRG